MASAARPTPPLTVASIAAELDDLARRTGDPRARRAAGLLRGRPGHRPEIDDRAALVEVAALLEHQQASSVEEASRLVACTQGGTTHSVGAAAKRIARKYRSTDSQMNKSVSRARPASPKVTK